MATRALTPFLRHSLRLNSKTASTTPTRRFLNTETAPSLYSAKAHVVGARTGSVAPSSKPQYQHTLTTPPSQCPILLPNQANRFQSRRRREPQSLANNGQSPRRSRRRRKNESRRALRRGLRRLFPVGHERSRAHAGRQDAE